MGRHNGLMARELDSAGGEQSRFKARPGLEYGVSG